MKHIYYVHDDQGNHKSRKDYMELAGYKVTVFEDARRCLSMIKNEKPDLLVADILLEGMHGFDLCEQTRQLFGAFQLPVILCSTIYRGAAYVQEAERVGAQEYLIRPLDLNDFIDHVNKLLKATDPDSSAAA
jgi:CheY-like chemotaxis protein